MRITNIFFLCIAAFLLSACGGGGGSTQGSAPQLAATGVDLSGYKSTFADTTLVNGPLLTESTGFGRFSRFLAKMGIVSAASAQTLSKCNDNVKPVAMKSGVDGNQVNKLALTQKESDQPCFTSSQEVGAYIAVQAKNLFQGGRKCDIALIPKLGGALHCLSLDLPADILDGAGGPELKFSQAFAGNSSLKSLGGKITDNGRYFFVAFSDDGTRVKGYDGVFRINLDAESPSGVIAYLTEGVNPRELSFDGYQQLENGDIIVSRMDLVAPEGARRFYTYYVGVPESFSDIASQQIVLINSAIEYGFEEFESPIFSWARANLSIGGDPIRSGGSQNIVFSGSQDPGVKIFYYVIAVDRYQRFSGEYFNSLLIKGTVVGSSIEFEDYGPTSISFYGTAGVKSDLSRIYWVKDWTPGTASVLTRDLSRRVDSTDRDFLPETELAIDVSLPEDYRPSLIYPTANKIFLSAVKTGYWDAGEPMNLRLFVADKFSNSVYWADRRDAFTEIDLSAYLGDGFSLKSAIPSLVSDKLVLRVVRKADNTEFSIDASSAGIDVIDLGSRGAVSARHAVVSGR